LALHAASRSESKQSRHLSRRGGRNRLNFVRSCGSWANSGAGRPRKRVWRAEEGTAAKSPAIQALGPNLAPKPGKANGHISSAFAQGGSSPLARCTQRIRTSCWRTGDEHLISAYRIAMALGGVIPCRSRNRNVGYERRPCASSAVEFGRNQRRQRISTVRARRAGSTAGGRRPPAAFRRRPARPRSRARAPGSCGSAGVAMGS
jgi:hypothetical protein